MEETPYAEINRLLESLLSAMEIAMPRKLIVSIQQGE